jgi:hypothetical protein
MAKNICRIAGRLGAKVVTRLPDVGGGAFGAARLAAVVETLRRRLVPGQGLRPGRPTDPNWIHRPKVPMSEATERLLTRLAEQASTAGRKVSPMQLAAQILEDALTGIPASSPKSNRENGFTEARKH